MLCLDPTIAPASLSRPHYHSCHHSQSGSGCINGGSLRYIYWPTGQTRGGGVFPRHSIDLVKPLRRIPAIAARLRVAWIWIMRTSGIRNLCIGISVGSTEALTSPSHIVALQTKIGNWSSKVNAILIATLNVVGLVTRRKVILPRGIDCPKVPISNIIFKTTDKHVILCPSCRRVRDRGCCPTCAARGGCALCGRTCGRVAHVGRIAHAIPPLTNI